METRHGADTGVREKRIRPSILARRLSVTPQHLHRLCVEHRLRRIKKNAQAKRHTYLFPEDTVRQLEKLVGDED